MYKKVIIPALAFFLLGFVFMAFYGFGNNDSKKYKDHIPAIDSFDSIVVLELFTSQGCSSCPPADKLLQQVKEKYPNTVYALSYHVDYWNYIGWEDPFSKTRFTKKQTLYNRKLGYNGNYTPEVIVNGREHFVGSNTAKMTTKILAYEKKHAPNKINVTNAKRAGGTITFDFAILGDTTEKLVRAVLVLDGRTTLVKRGENRNRTLTNSNIVVAEKYIEPSGDFGSGSIEIPNLVRPKEEITLLLLVENDNMDITGAAKAKF